MSRLLIVDDDPVFRERLATAFRRRSYEVTTAGSAAEATTHIHAGEFDQAVLDLKLGGGPSGLDVLRDLRRASPNARVVVLTGYGSIATAIDAIRFGAADYLSKPADAEQILAALRGDGGHAPPEVSTPSLDRVEWEHLQRVLAECGGNISKAARVLGLERRSLQRRLRKLPPAK
ncbi:MAG: response regulator [Terrimicrobiaceae bacterium]